MPLHHANIINRDANLSQEQERIEYIRYQGYEIEIAWECEYQDLMKPSPEFRDFIDTQRRQRPLEHRNSLSTHGILSAIREKKLFCATEVDFHVPNHLLDHFREMSPIFCNADIPFDAVGDYSRETARKFQISENSRRLLVGGVRARRILLATPLLKWYLEHGLVVSRVHQVVEFTPNPCFAGFTKKSAMLVVAEMNTSLRDLYRYDEIDR